MSRRLQDMFWDIDLTSTEQLVAQRLAWHADDGTGKCWPGIRLICDKTGLKERAVQIAIKSLAAAGHVTREEALGLGVVYFVHPRMLCGGTRAQNGDEEPASKPVHDVRPRTKDTPAPDAPTPARRAPKQVKNRSNDKHGERTRDANAVVPGQRGRRIDIDWQPAKPLPDDLTKAVAGWPPGREAQELTEFRDFWLADAGQRACKVDWDRTWWNRIRSILKYDQRREDRDTRHGQRHRQTRPSGWAARPGMAGAEPAYLDD